MYCFDLIFTKAHFLCCREINKILHLYKRSELLHSKFTGMLKAVMVKKYSQLNSQQIKRKQTNKQNPQLCTKHKHENVCALIVQIKMQQSKILLPESTYTAT